MKRQKKLTRRERRARERDLVQDLGVVEWHRNRHAVQVLYEATQLFATIHGRPPRTFDETVAAIGQVQGSDQLPDGFKESMAFTASNAVRKLERELGVTLE